MVELGSLGSRMDRVRRAGYDAATAAEEGGLWVETPRGCVDVSGFREHQIGYSDVGFIFAIEHFAEEEDEQFRVACDLARLGVDDPIVIWCHNQPIYLYQIAHGSESNISGTPGQPIQISIDYTFIEVEPF